MLLVRTQNLSNNTLTDRNFLGRGHGVEVMAKLSQSQRRVAKLEARRQRKGHRPASASQSPRASAASVVRTILAVPDQFAALARIIDNALARSDTEITVAVVPDGLAVRARPTPCMECGSTGGVEGFRYMGGQKPFHWFRFRIRIGNTIWLCRECMGRPMTTEERAHYEWLKSKRAAREARRTARATTS